MCKAESCQPDLFAGITRIADKIKYFASRPKLAANMIMSEFVKIKNLTPFWMRNTLLGEDISLVRCSAMPKIKCVERNTALSVSQVAGIAHIGGKMK